MEQGALEFDFEALRERYRIERDKRVRADGNDQYIEVTGDFSRYVDDPYVEPGFQREPVEKDFDVVIIGGGFGGMLAAARLVEAGIDNIALIEKGGDFGGTWYWNRYPGASCDIEAYVYLPMLEETGFVPKKKYTDAPETLEYCRVLAEKFALKEKALMQTEVLSTQWDE
ncbi:MAG: NAD(P)-binding protein, partial [Pseudomonadales bacterium]